jgi:class 3 adenylate cyclase
MLVSSDPAALAEVAVKLVDEFNEPLSVRAGLASGDVVAREGDYFGTAVNLAARLIATAAPGTVVSSESFAEMLPEAWRREQLPSQSFKGFDEDVPIVRLRR